MSYKLTALDKLILNRIQSDFPVTSAPYAQIGEELGLTECKVQSRVKQLKCQKIIRRIGFIFDTAKLGFVSTLVGLKISSHKLKQIGKKIAQYDTVTHCYARTHEFNLWFTLTCKSHKEISKTLLKINNYSGIKKMLYLPAIKTFKIRAEFRLD